MSQDHKPETSDTDSVPPVFRLPDGLNGQFASVKCSECKTVTRHEWLKISPVSDVIGDPLVLLKLTKRLTLCTQCGTLKTIN